MKSSEAGIQGYLDHKKQRPLRTLPLEYALDPMAALREGALSYERGSPVEQGLQTGSRRA